MKNKNKVMEKISKDLQDSDVKFNFYIKDSILKLINEEENSETNIDINNEEEIKEIDVSQNMEEEEI